MCPPVRSPSSSAGHIDGSCSCAAERNRQLTAPYGTLRLDSHIHTGQPIVAPCNVLCYSLGVIKSFAHGGVKRFFENGKAKGLPQDMVKRLRIRLDALEAAKEPKEMEISGWDLHELKGERKGTWSIKVTANYRLTFKLDAGEAREVNLEDYH